MTQARWQEKSLPEVYKDHAWELFHENSKLGRYQKPLSDEQVLTRMESFYETLPFEGYPMTPLPQASTFESVSLADAFVHRTSTRDLSPMALPLSNLASLLHYGYGVTRDNHGTTFPRPFRTVPSGGALYPLEIFFHASNVEELPAGLYHYNPTHHHVRLLREGDETDRLAPSVVQPEVVKGASVTIFLTAIFERSIFKYRDRGYRFILIEAGHVAQNMNLVSVALGLGMVNLGGFFDREVDEFLGLDGVTHSTLYMLAVGGKATHTT